MPANYDIRINGICLCFYTDHLLNVIFPCDDNHKATFWYDGGPQELREDQRAMVIDFPEDAIPGPPPLTIPSPVPLFNMSADYSHGYTEDVHGNRESHLKLLDVSKETDPQTKKFRDYVWLKIPNASYYSRTETPCPYYVQDVSSGAGLPMSIIHKVAREVVISFTVIKDFKLEAKDLRAAGHTTPVGKTFTTTPNADLIEIDNDCHGASCPKENDFFHLYWIVRDVKEPGKMLAAGQVLCPQAEEGPAIGQGRARIDTAGFTSSYGNCDPIETVPPPN